VFWNEFITIDFKRKLLNYLCYSDMGWYFIRISICDSKISSLFDFQFIGVATHPWQMGLCNEQEIISATVNLNAIDLSKYFTDTISAP